MMTTMTAATVTTTLAVARDAELEGRAEVAAELRATVFGPVFDGFVASVQDIVSAHFAKSFPNLKACKITVDSGRRYMRIVRTTDDGEGQRSVYCFVDRTNGNVLKAAGWKAPAKHARGNIFADDGGLGAVGAYGANYLR